MRKVKEKRWAKRGAMIALLCVGSASRDFVVGTVYRATFDGEWYLSCGEDGDYLFSLPLDGGVWQFKVV